MRFAQITVPLAEVALHVQPVVEHRAAGFDAGQEPATRPFLDGALGLPEPTGQFGAGDETFVLRVVEQVRRVGCIHEAYRLLLISSGPVRACGAWARPRQCKGGRRRRGRGEKWGCGNLPLLAAGRGTVWRECGKIFFAFRC